MTCASCGAQCSAGICGICRGKLPESTKAAWDNGGLLKEHAAAIIRTRSASVKTLGGGRHTKERV